MPSTMLATITSTLGQRPVFLLLKLFVSSILQFYLFDSLLETHFYNRNGATLYT